ncbi:MAG: LicD family protein [Eubacterium sp.]|nr:LicD family protein [Eubacterium sp.]
MKRQITDIKEIQKLELDILLSLIKYFEENSIQYFSYAGTTIGSVRHKGFIPWDDDVDLLIPRADYERLLEISDGKLIDGYIEIKKPGDRDYIYPYSKACNVNTVIYEKNVTDKKYATGIFVDLFPFDNLSNSALKNKLLFIRIAFLRSMLETASDQVNLSKKGSVRYILKQIARTLQKPAAKLIGVERLAKKLNSYGKKQLKIKSDYIGDIYFYDTYSKKYFETASKGDFEGYEINNPVGWHEYLTQAYGDYMTPPPEDKRGGHAFEAWYTDKE